MDKDPMKSIRHVEHEIEMVKASFDLLQKVLPDDASGLRQALTTSFAVRARALHDFFSSEAPRRASDIIAKALVPTWRCDGLDQATLTRINKELAHLTYERNDQPPEGWRFDAGPVWEQLKPIIARFEEAARAAGLLPSEMWACPYAKFPLNQANTVSMSAADVPTMTLGPLDFAPKAKG